MKIKLNTLKRQVHIWDQSWTVNDNVTLWHGINMDNTVMSKTPFGQIGVINVHKPAEQLASISVAWPDKSFISAQLR